MFEKNVANEWALPLLFQARISTWVNRKRAFQTSQLVIVRGNASRFSEVAGNTAEDRGPTAGVKFVAHTRRSSFSFSSSSAGYFRQITRMRESRCIFAFGVCFAPSRPAVSSISLSVTSSEMSRLQGTRSSPSLFPLAKRLLADTDELLLLRYLLWSYQGFGTEK